MVSNDGSVKLLDFGALKHIGPGSDASSAVTQAGLRPITLRYSSPEHMQGSAVTTSADVYSLGMILYRVIARRHPFDDQEISLAGHLDRLENQNLQPPSQAALENFDLASSLRFSGDMARDLDAIVTRAIQYEPEDRYQTVSALAEEIWSVLLHRPVLARRGSYFYRTSKFLRRHRWPVLIGTAAALVTAAGVTAMQWQTQQATLQQRRADQGVEEERKLVHLLLFGYFKQLSLVPGSIDPQRKAVTLALEYLDSLAAIAPGSSLELDRIAGYTDMGMLLGNSYEQNLGDVPGALQALNKALAIASKQFETAPHDAKTMQAYTQAEYSLGSTYLGNGDAAQAEPHLARALSIAEALASRPTADADALHQAASVSDTLGDVYDPGRGYATADEEKALKTYLLSNSFDEQCRVVFPANQDCWSNTVVGDYKIGSLVEDTDPALAAKQYAHGLTVVRAFPPELAKTTHSRRLRDYMLARLGLMDLRLGKREEGDTLVHQALEGFRQSIREAELDNRARFDLVAFETDLAAEYDRLGREQDASSASDEVLATLGVLLTRSPSNRRWQMIQAEDMITAARAKTQIGQRQKSAQLRREGLNQAVRLAEARDASPEALGFAADDLVELLPYSAHPGQDARMAVDFAQRAANAFAKPAPARYLTLAKAEAAAGQSDRAKQTARLVLNGLSGPVKSKLVAEQVTEARRLAGIQP
jgi:tetratricopeptide (TPR) repeat protein